MSQARTIVSSGLSAQNARAVLGYVQEGQTALGTTINNAFALGADITQFTTVAAGTGAQLPPMSPGDSIAVFNKGANALLVYPPNAAAVINGLGAGAGYSVATATPFAEFICLDANTFIARQSA